MPSFSKLYARYDAAFKRTTAPLVRWMRKNDLKQTASLFEVAGASMFAFIVVPVGVVLPAVILGTLVSPLAGLTAAVSLGPTSMAMFFGALSLEEAVENTNNKRKIKTFTNLAGQTVTGNAYDIGRLQNYERRADYLSQAIEAEKDVEEKIRLGIRLTDTFAEAAPHIARVNIIADPAAPEGTTPAFAFARQKTTTQTARL